LNSAKKVSKKIINKSINELTNQYLQSTEYNTTVLNYDHTQNRVPSFLSGNVALIEPPKNIATNKQVNSEKNILNNSATVDENTQKAQIVQITKNDQQYNTAEMISDNSRTYNNQSRNLDSIKK